MRADRLVAIGIAFVPTLFWLVIAAVEGVEAAVIGGAEGPRGVQLVVYWAITTTPWFVATWLVWRAWSRSAPDGDPAERLVAVAAHSLRRDRAEWGDAMRAELAGIEGRGPRWRFAVGCTWAAIVAPTRGRRIAVGYGLAGGLLMGVGLIAYSRWSIVHSPGGGIVTYLILGPAAIAFCTALLAAARARAFGTGFATALLCAVTGLPAMALAAVPETLHWYHVDTRALFDGEGGLPLGSQPEMLPGFLLVAACFWLCLGVIGAAIGAGIGHRIPARAATPAVPGRP